MELEILFTMQYKIWWTEVGVRRDRKKHKVKNSKVRVRCDVRENDYTDFRSFVNCFYRVLKPRVLLYATENFTFAS